MVFTMITPMALGIMCLRMIRKLLAPATFAASTNSRSRRVRNSPRTSRASVVQVIAPSATASQKAPAEPASLPSTAPITITGKVMNRSVKRIRTWSMPPRK